MEEKKWYPRARTSVSTSRNKVIFQNLDLPVSEQKSLNEKNIVSTRQKVGFD